MLMRLERSQPTFLRAQCPQCAVGQAERSYWGEQWGGGWCLPPGRAAQVRDRDRVSAGVRIRVKVWVGVGVWVESEDGVRVRNEVGVRVRLGMRLGLGLGHLQGWNTYSSLDSLCQAFTTVEVLPYEHPHGLLWTCSTSSMPPWLSPHKLHAVHRMWLSRARWLSPAGMAALCGGDMNQVRAVWSGLGMQDCTRALPRCCSHCQHLCSPPCPINLMLFRRSYLPQLWLCAGCQPSPGVKSSLHRSVCPWWGC